METTIQILKTIGGGIVSGLSFLFGGLDTMLLITLIFIALDYVSALTLAGYEGKVNSSVGRKGFFGKIMYLLFICVGALFDYVLGTDYVKIGVCGFIIFNEAISILENAGRMPNVKIPTVLLNAIEVLKNKGDGKK